MHYPPSQRFAYACLPRVPAWFSRGGEMLHSPTLTGSPVPSAPSAVHNALLLRPGNAPVSFSQLKIYIWHKKTTCKKKLSIKES